jgi:hypothetical protein
VVVADFREHEKRRGSPTSPIKTGSVTSTINNFDYYQSGDEYASEGTITVRASK